MAAHALILLAATENAADHLTPFYLFFMPAITRPVYAGRAWFDDAQRRFASNGGEQLRQALAARARWFELMGLLGSRWPWCRANPSPPSPCCRPTARVWA